MKVHGNEMSITKYGQFFIEEYKHFIKVHNMAFPSQFTDQMSEYQRPNIPDLNPNEHIKFVDPRGRNKMEFEEENFSRKRNMA